MPDMVFTNLVKKGQKFMKKKNLAFTLAEVLIVIGIIGVVAALTLPNLNHATGDKETVTRLQKAYSILNEANDRAVAIYGPLSEWSGNCINNINACWVKRIGEFLKVSNSCNTEEGINCDNLDSNGALDYDKVILQLSDGATIGANGYYFDCDGEYGDFSSGWFYVNDLCSEEIRIDIDGPNKGKNEEGKDIFQFLLSDKLGLIPVKNDNSLADEVSACLSERTAFDCTWWVLEFENLDYLKADSSGKCNDSNIILDGVTNTSCH